MPKLIALDLDGTLFRKDKTISSHSIDVLRRCREKGHYVVIATGRTEKDCERIFPDILPTALISSDGAYVRYGEEVLLQKTIPKATFSALMAWCRACPNIKDILIDTPTGYIMSSVPSLPQQYLNDFLNVTTIVESLDGIETKTAAYGLNVDTSEPAEVAALAQSFPDIRLMRFESMFTLWPADTGKWPALEILSARLNIAKQDIIAFGDECNDIEMIEKSGTGVAMANAIEAVKAVSNHICDTNDNDGIAKWLADNLL